MVRHQDAVRDLAVLPVPLVGSLQETGDRWEPYRIVDAADEPVAAVAEFFRELQAAGRSEATLRGLAKLLDGCSASPATPGRTGGWPAGRTRPASDGPDCRWVMNHPRGISATS